MAYPAEFKRRVRSAYIQGRGSLTLLAREFGVKNPHTLFKWAKDGDWDNLKQEAQAKAAQKCLRNDIEKIAENNTQVKTVWDALMHQVMLRLKNADKKLGIDPNDIARLSRSMSHIQDGQRLALGADQMEDVTDHEIKIIYKPLHERVKEAREARENGSTDDDE